MSDDLGTLRAYLDKLTALVERTRLSRSAEDRARMERSIRLVIWALQTVARSQQQQGEAALQCQAAEFAALSRQIVKTARAAGLRIGDNDNWD